MKKIGLTLGKYAPLHSGHVLVFETALQEVDELYVLIYQSSITSIPLNIRAQWIRDLFPQIHVIEAWDGPEGYSNDRAFEIEQENYIIQKLNAAANAQPATIDSTRSKLPVSSTKALPMRASSRSMWAMWRRPSSMPCRCRAWTV